MGRIDLEINGDSSKTRKYNSDLRKYIKSKILNNKFICCHYSECKKSHSGKFYEGQPYHIGKYYDLKINKKPFRIMIVGQEFGHKKKKITLKEKFMKEMCCPGEEDWIFKKRNPHMKGTTSVLRLLFGKDLGVDYESEWINMTNGKKCHIFDAFALVNYLFCSALKEGHGMAGHSTRKMKNNCREHFKNTVKRLKPNVIIVQGFMIGEWIKDSFDDIKPISGTKIIYQAKLNNFSTNIAFFSHPSSRGKKLNWGSNDHTEYLLKTVKPSVKKIQQIIGII